MPTPSRRVIRLVLVPALSAFAALWTGCHKEPQVIYGALPPTEGMLDFKTLYVEGATVDAVEGVLIERVPPGNPEGPDRLGIRTETGQELYFLENRQLQQLQAALTEAGSREGVRLRLGGRTTIYRNDNYLLLSGRMFLRDPEVEIRMPGAETDERQ